MQLYKMANKKLFQIIQHKKTYFLRKLVEPHNFARLELNVFAVSGKIRIQKKCVL